MYIWRVQCTKKQVTYNILIKKKKKKKNSEVLFKLGNTDYFIK